MKQHRLSIVLRDLADKIDTFESTNDDDDQVANAKMDLLYNELMDSFKDAKVEMDKYLNREE